MELHAEAECYIRESIEASLGLPVSSSTLRSKLLASEDERRRLQDQIFVLEGRIRDSERRLELYKEEASMSAKGIQRCVKEKEELESRYNELATHCTKLESECNLYERDLEKVMETCDELGREIEEHRAGQRDNSKIQSLLNEVETLKKDKEHLRVNLHTAEEEVKILFEENRVLDHENQRLLKQLNKERLVRGGSEGGVYSSGTSAMGKRKSRLKEGTNSSPALASSTAEQQRVVNGRKGSPAAAAEPSSPARQPLSPLHHYNSPESRMHKKLTGVAAD